MITDTQVSQLAKNFAQNVAEESDIEFLKQFYIDSYVDRTAGDLGMIIDDMYDSDHVSIWSIKSMMVEAGMSSTDVEARLSYSHLQKTA